MIQELDYDYNVHQNNKGDENLAVRFYIAPIKNPAKSTDAGRPIFDDTQMVEIRVRGDRNNVVQRPVREEDKRRFRDAWRAFEEGSKDLDSGTPLSQWPIASQSFVEEMKYLGFHTVEHLATANDRVCADIPGLVTMRERAKHYIELAKGVSPIEGMQEKLDEQEHTIQAQAAQLADLNRMVQELKAASGEKSGGSAAKR